MIKLGNNFALPQSIDLSVLDTIPVHVHVYGEEPPDKSVFRWMEYRNEGGSTGSIGFARDLGTFMPEVAAYVKSYLESLMDIKVDPHRVNFMRTSGDVPPHRDEGGRLCCINIGVRDSHAAITRTSNDDDLKTFDTNYTDHVVEVGCAYLLDVSRAHAVISTEPKSRLLVTYGFGIPAAQVITKRKT